MVPIPVPEPYTFPVTLRVTRKIFIGNIAFGLLFVGIFLYGLITINPSVDPMTWIICLLAGVLLGVTSLEIISREIRLTDDRIFYREWFYWREMEYTKITAVQYYYQIESQSGGKFPILELSGRAGTKMALGLGMFESPANLWIIYDVLRKKAIRADICQTTETFFADPNAIAWQRIKEPEPYTLPLTLGVDRGSSILLSVLFLPVIAGILYFGVFLSPPQNLATWVFFFLITGGFLIGYLALVMPAIRLSGDRISCRDHFFAKEMEYRRITAVRYYYRDTWSAWDSGPVLELSADTGDMITISLGMFISSEHLPLIYDVLKKNAPRANLPQSPREFFARPGTIVAS
jgi:hypothetical protein